MEIKILNDLYGIFSMEPDKIPQLPPEVQGSFFSITYTGEEISVVCKDDLLYLFSGSRANLSWKCLKIMGPLDFSLVGVLSKILNILKKARISVFTVSTYLTDYILIKAGKLESAVRYLKKAGYEIISEQQT